jgi:Lon protease-like protein
MRAKGTRSDFEAQLPEIIPVFPLAGGLLLPRGQMPLNIFEPRYIEMVDSVLRGDRIIGVIQPQDESESEAFAPRLQSIGCAGRITSYSETGDGRYLITLTGIARFAVLEEIATGTPYRRCRVTAEPFAMDFAVRGESDVDRETLINAFRAYLEANDLEADWDSVDRASNESLVNAIAMIGPYGPAEKQALLEAPDLKTRAETLVALTEISLAADTGRRLQ